MHFSFLLRQRTVPSVCYGLCHFSAEPSSRPNRGQGNARDFWYNPHVKIRLSVLLSVLLACVCRIAAADAAADMPVARSIADLNAAANAADGKTMRFDITARITQPGIPGKRSFVAEDETGVARFGTNPSISHLCPTNAGDIVHIRGVTTHSRSRTRRFENDTTEIELVRHGPRPEPIPISGHELYSRRDTFQRLVAIDGTVHDTFRDEIDPLYSFIVLNSGGVIVYVAVFSEYVTRTELDALVGSTVSIVGINDENGLGGRTLLQRLVYVNSLSDIKALSASAAEPFDVPPLSEPPLSEPPLSLGATLSESSRRRATGHVIAVWNAASSALMSTDNGELLRVDLRTPPAPRYGEHVEVVGLPETDLYHVNLTRAIWRPAPGRPFADEEPVDVTAEQLVSSSSDVTVKNAGLHGRAVRIRGVVRGLPAVGLENDKVYLESNQALVPIDASSCPQSFKDIAAGCTVEVSGTLVNDTENWRPNRVLPQIREVLIAVRKPGDVRVLARPPWWTTGRLFALVGALVAVIFGIFAWNVALRRRAERRGQELADERVAHIASELKVVERTRLAVELHDSLSQTLTGVSMGIDAALDMAGDVPGDLKGQLRYTSRAVEACRTELKNCLWDLRSQALGESDMNAAIKLALSQIVSRTALDVRFDAPRELFSDNTAHTILRIVRELASNAVRHGHATSIRIAGSADGGTLRLSVADNGRGFDIETAPGVLEGHFGLQGIRERVDRLDGTFDIESSPGGGTRVQVTMKIQDLIPRASGGGSLTPELQDERGSQAT